MKESLTILYVAKHDSGGNDDEGAITHALCKLGHNVQRVRELVGETAHRVEADFCLFHKWDDWPSLRLIRCPKVFWHFDLIDWPSDLTLARRCSMRIAWMRQVLPLVSLGFCTDGDWVAEGAAKHLGSEPASKLRLLRQGFDERLAPAPRFRCGSCGSEEGVIDILFTGISKGGGMVRESFVAEMRERWGDRFHHVKEGLHGPALAQMIAASKIVVAPDSPVTGRYWSNRAYNVLGLGGFLLHPFCEGLNDELLSVDPHPSAIFYWGRDDLHETIKGLLASPKSLSEVAANGRTVALNRLTYRHRCEELVRVVRETLGI